MRALALFMLAFSTLLPATALGNGTATTVDSLAGSGHPSVWTGRFHTTRRFAFNVVQQQQSARQYAITRALLWTSVFAGEALLFGMPSLPSMAIALYDTASVHIAHHGWNISAWTPERSALPTKHEGLGAGIARAVFNIDSGLQVLWHSAVNALNNHLAKPTQRVRWWWQGPSTHESYEQRFARLMKDEAGSDVTWQLSDGRDFAFVLAETLSATGILP